MKKKCDSNVWKSTALSLFLICVAFLAIFVIETIKPGFIFTPIVINNQPPLNISDTNIVSAEQYTNNYGIDRNDKKVVIDRTILDTLQHAYTRDTEYAGCLYGTYDNTTIHITGFKERDYIERNGSYVRAVIPIECGFGFIHSHITRDEKTPLCYPSVTDIFTWGRIIPLTTPPHLEAIQCGKDSFYFAIKEPDVIGVDLRNIPLTITD